MSAVIVLIQILRYPVLFPVYHVCHQGETPYDMAKRHQVSWMGKHWLRQLEPPDLVRRNPCQRLVTNPVRTKKPVQRLVTNLVRGLRTPASGSPLTP